MAVVAGVEPRALRPRRHLGHRDVARVLGAVLGRVEVDVSGEEADEVLGVIGLANVSCGLRLLEGEGVQLSRGRGPLLKLSEFRKGFRSEILKSKD